MNFKCGKCGIVYEFEDFIKLEREEAVDDDPNYGKVAVCKCGYRFHKDWMRLTTKLQKSDVVVVISTVFLEMKHYDDDEIYYYETAIFPINSQNKVIECDYREGYVEREEAERGHQRAINLINGSKYRLEENNLIVEEISD